MFKKIRALAIVLLSVALAAASFTPVSAASPEYTTTAVTWHSPGKLLAVEKNSKECVLSVEVGERTQKLFVSFPKEGGFRLHAEKAGYFQPEALGDIAYSSRDGATIMKGSDGTTAALTVKDGKRWEIVVSNAAGDRLFPLSGEQIGFGYDGNGEMERVRLEAPLADNEMLYGSGERFNYFNLVGKRITLWNVDAPRGTNDGAYKNIPIFNSTRGYTLFFNSTYGATADIGKSSAKKYTLDFGGPIFDFFVWTGTPTANLGAYTSLTGRPAVLPKWGYQYWAGNGANYWTQGGDSLTKFKSLLTDYQKIGTPNIAAVYGEGNPSEDSRAYSALKNSGSRMLMWNYPYATRSQINSLIPTVPVADIPRLKSLLNPWDEPGDFLDYSNPTAVTFMRAKLRSQFSWGLKGMMVDYGEYVPPDTVAYNGMTGREMHNFYAYSYGKAMNETFSQELGNDFVLFARAGCAGSQTWNGVFSGDQQADWNGLRQQVNAVLSISASGFSSWGGDIGGYFGKPTQDLYRRWLQFATFTPLMRAHSNFYGKDPWNYGDASVKTFQTCYWLRENLLDTIYSSALISNKTGEPMVKSMAFAFPDESGLAAVDDQYVFCNALLVAPVLTEGAYYRTVKLPRGMWYDLWTGEAQTGDRTITAYAPPQQTPVYIQAGAVLSGKVADSFRLTDSMLQEDDTQEGNPCLIVTPPDKTTATTFWQDADTSRVYHNICNSASSFTIKADKTSEIPVVLAYGTSAASVKVDGQPIDRLDTYPQYSDGVVGYYLDGRSRVVVSLPASWQTIEFSCAEKTDLAQNQKVTGNKGETAALTDNKVETVQKIDGGDSWLLLDLGAVKTVDTVALKWAASYAKEYTVEASADGEAWFAVYKAEESFGSGEEIAFEPQDLRYIRLSGFTRAEKLLEPVLAEISVYGADVNAPAENPGQEDPIVPPPDNGSDLPNVTDLTDPLPEESDSNSSSAPLPDSSDSQSPANPSRKRVVYYDEYIYWPFIAGGAVLVIGGGVTAVLLIRRKKRKVPSAKNTGEGPEKKPK